MPKKIIIGEIPISVTFKPIKNVHLSVHPPLGEVTVSAPEDMDLEKIKAYCATKFSWIRRQQKKISGQKRENSHLYITKESHYFLGKRYLLKVTEKEIAKNQAKVVEHHNKLELLVPLESEADFKKNLLQNWYRAELRTVIGEMVHHYSSIMEISVPQFSIRQMKTKWGSCNDEKKTLLFNTELAKKPIDTIEYIVVHELVHLKVRNHNKDFIALMNRYLPNWELRKKQLNNLPV